MFFWGNDFVSCSSPTDYFQFLKHSAYQVLGRPLYSSGSLIFTSDFYDAKDPITGGGPRWVGVHFSPFFTIGGCPGGGFQGYLYNLAFKVDAGEICSVFSQKNGVKA